MDIYSLYSGFSIDVASGNNAFSYELRKTKSIYVAPLIKGTPDDLQISEHTAFSEIVDDTEYDLPGLKNFIHWHYQGRECFIFDNHNHAFFFWAYALQKELFSAGATLVHVDQHTDMRNPQKMIAADELNDLKRVFDYTNYELNVGNFIQPALHTGLFKAMDIIDSSWTFDNEYDKAVVLDVDMDIFSDDMDYIKDDLKVKKIREFARQASFITIATSPFFIDQDKVIKKIKEIFS